MLVKSLAVFSALAAVPLASAVTHNVTVGGAAGLVFTPNQVTGAVKGDVIHFIFQAKNHTATQSSFDTPCANTPQGGFDSGFYAVDVTTTTNFPTYDLTINGTDPVWVYCAQVNHCKAGMVFAVNAPTTNQTFDQFMANAKGPSSASASPTGVAATSLGSSKPSPTGNAAGRAVASVNWKAMGAVALGVLAGAAVVV